MSTMTSALALFLLANLLVALLRVVRGPTAADRLLAALLFGTTGVAVLLLMAGAGARDGLVDAALVFALLAAITGAAFAQRAWRRDKHDSHDAHYGHEPGHHRGGRDAHGGSAAGSDPAAQADNRFGGW